MATGPGQELDLTRLVAIVLFLIVGVIYARGFAHHYFFESARAAQRAQHGLETARASGPLPPIATPAPGNPLYERFQRVQQYMQTGDEQAKRWLIRDAKRRYRAKHWLAIWGSLAVASVSTIIVISAGLPMLLERRR